MQPQAIDITKWQKVIEEIARKTHEGELKKGALSEEYITQTYNELNNAARTGYGKDWLKINNDTGAADPVVLKMKQNLYRFSQAKSYAMQLTINELLHHNGKLRNWEDFKQEVLKLNNKYNLNYLQAEWQTARQSGHHAHNWQEYVRNKERYPNLEYLTQKDDRVREEHERLHGKIAPVDSSFWNKYYPPNGWRCRCYVRQTDKPATKNIEIDENVVKPEFRINVGISGEVFKYTADKAGKAHPYFALANRADNDTREAFELNKYKAPIEEVYKSTNGTVVSANIFTDPIDYEKNLEAARIAADNEGIGLILRADVKINGIKNAEYELNGIKGDRVSPKWSENSKINTIVDNAFRGKLSKSNDGQLSSESECFLLLETTNLSSIESNVSLFSKKIYMNMNKYKSVSFVMIYDAIKKKSLIIKQADLANNSKFRNSIIQFFK